MVVIILATAHLPANIFDIGIIYTPPPNELQPPLLLQVTNIRYRGWDGGANVETFCGQRVNLLFQQTRGFLVPPVCWMDARYPGTLFEKAEEVPWRMLCLGRT